MTTIILCLLSAIVGAALGVLFVCLCAVGWHAKDEGEEGE